MARMLAEFNGSVPISQACTPPSSWYLGDDFARVEFGALSRTWQFGCRLDQVATPGSYVATFIGAEPVLIVRGEDGTLRAFHNACRHKAAPVASGEGKCKQFVCPYHAWTYNLQGRLTKAVKLKGIENFSAPKVSLPPVAVQQFGPLVFVNLTPAGVSSPVPDVESSLKEVQQRLEDNGGWEAGAVPWRSLSHLRRRVYEIKCNWKVRIRA